MVDDPDAIWKPGGPRPAPVRPVTFAREADGLPDVAPPTQPRRLAVPVAAAVALIAVAAAVFVVSRGGSGPERSGAIGAIDRAADVSAARSVDPLVASPFAGADVRRLPNELTQRWAVDLPDLASSSQPRLFVDGDRTVLAVLDAMLAEPEDGPASVMVALDARTGVTRWQRAFNLEANDVRIIGVLDEVAVVEGFGLDDRSLIGIDIGTGSVRWERPTERPGEYVVLAGTPLISRLSFTGSPRITFIEPRAGIDVADIPGRFLATDHLGRWYVRSGDSVSELVLRDGWNPPTVLAQPTNQAAEAVTVVDGRLVEIRGEDLVARSGDAALEPVSLTLTSSAGIEPPTSFQRLGEFAGSAFLIAGDGAVFGANLDGDVVDIRWRSAGTVVDTVTTDRGLALLIARDGGAEQRVVDGSTGRTITDVPLLPGAIETLQVVGNGVVVKRPAAIGSERVGLGLDGTLLWSLVGEGPLAVGDGIVVVLDAAAVGVTLSAYGAAAN